MYNQCVPRYRLYKVTQAVNVAESEKRITVRISESLHRKVKAKAALSGKSISDVLREYLEAWVEEPLSEPEKED